MKKRFAASCGIALIGFALIVALAACEISAPIAGASGEAKGVEKTSDSTVPLKVVGTAGIGAEAFFFEFDMSGTHKFARAFVPVSPDGFLKNGKILYKKERYALKEFSYDAGSGYLYGSTATVAGVWYSFYGMYSNQSGFIGNIKKMVNGIAYGEKADLFHGYPIFKGQNADNYIGIASFDFNSDTLALIFNAVIDNTDGSIRGSWCETKPASEKTGAAFNIHGYVFGTQNSAENSVSFEGSYLPVPEYEELLGQLNATGTGTYKNAGEKLINGKFVIDWNGVPLNSAFVAERVEN